MQRTARRTLNGYAAGPLAAIIGIVTSGCVIQESSRPDPYYGGRPIETTRELLERFEAAGHNPVELARIEAMTDVNPSAPPPGRWFLPDDPKRVRGAAVLTTGLNNHPSSVESYAEFLASSGVAAFVTTLTHQGDRMHGASIDLWVDELDAAWDHAAARFPDVPMIQLGYSTGGMATVVHAHERPDPRRRALVLVAPAVKLRAYAYLSRPPKWLRGRSLVFPSRAPKRYRAHQFTSWDSYGALHDGIARLADVEESAELSRVPTVVVMSPRDELISYQRVEKWATERALPWEFVPVRVERGFEHLVLDDSCGTETWGQIRSAILEHIGDALRL